LEFNERIPRECADANGGSHVTSGFAENADEQVGCPINYRGRVRESGNCVHVSVDGENFSHRIKGPQYRFQDRQLSESACTGGSITFFHSSILPHRAADDSLGIQGDGACEV
jgi:hypothetical protein